MKNILKFIRPFPASIAAAAIVALSMPQLTGCASGGGLTPTASADIQNALLTVANVAQELNTGVQTAAPSIDAILALTHNQGDATAVNNVVAQSAAAAPAINALLAGLNTAIKSATTPAAQTAAVNAALSPTAVAAIVAPIQAAEAVAPIPSSPAVPTTLWKSGPYSIEPVVMLWPDSPFDQSLAGN